MTAPVEHIKLTRIVSLVLRDLYSIRPPSLGRRIELSAKYTADLHAWRNSLSGFLAGSSPQGGIESQSLIPIFQRQRSVLNLAYHHAILLIHRPFLLRDFASLTHMPTHPNWGTNPNKTYDTTPNITACLEAAMAITRVVNDVFRSSNLFRSFWFTQYYAFCAVVVLYIHRIQQGLGVKNNVQSEGYYEKGVACQKQLETVRDTDCLARRYCLVLEELRVEAERQSTRLLSPVEAAGVQAADEVCFQENLISNAFSLSVMEQTLLTSFRSPRQLQTSTLSVPLYFPSPCPSPTPPRTNLLYRVSRILCTILPYSGLICSTGRIWLVGASLKVLSLRETVCMIQVCWEMRASFSLILILGGKIRACIFLVF